VGEKEKDKDRKIKERKGGRNVISPTLTTTPARLKTTQLHTLLHPKANLEHCSLPPPVELSIGF